MILINYILQLKKLLHKRIDPTIEVVCKPTNAERVQKDRIRSERYKQNKTEAEIPKGAPIWTLSREALEHLNWVNRDIPIYDPDEEDDNNNDEEVGTSSRKRKRKGKGKEKEKERKNKKSKKNKKK